jgi:raffinose/stachyose/melibiose transport system permease protein
MQWLSKWHTKCIMIIPTMLLYLAFVAVPIVVAVYYSFTNFTGVGQPAMVGAANYLTLFKDRTFLIALKNTGIILTGSLILVVPCSFALALLLNRTFRLSGLSKAMNFVPNIISPILVGLIWVFILDPSIGLINNLLNATGLGALKNDWIGGRTLTPYAVAVVSTWQKLGYFATVFIAGLRGVPGELYEAAQIDGADSRQTLWYITVPQIRGTFVVVFLLVITGCFKIFEIVVQLTNGGPNHLSDTLVTYMYYTTFTSSRYGYGMSIASAAFLITAVFSVIYIAVAREKLGEEG